MINTAQNLKEYKQRLKKALDNKFLRTAMGTFATAYKEAQGRLFAGVDVPALTREIAAGKDAALPRLEELYEAFKARAEAAGVKVHLAKTALEANEIIAGIARDSQAVSASFGPAAARRGSVLVFSGELPGPVQGANHPFGRRDHHPPGHIRFCSRRRTGGGIRRPDL